MVAAIELFEALKTRFGENEAKVIVKEIEKIDTAVDAKINKKFDDAQALFKNDISSLKEYLDKIFATKEDLAKTEGRLDIKIAETKAELIKWMFIFWMGQVAVMAGLLAYFFKFSR